MREVLETQALRCGGALGEFGKDGIFRAQVGNYTGLFTWLDFVGCDRLVTVLLSRTTVWVNLQRSGDTGGKPSANW